MLFKRITDAAKKASKVAKKRGVYIYVVKDGDEYGVADDYDLDTVFVAARVVATFGPDGEREYGYDY